LNLKPTTLSGIKNCLLWAIAMFATRNLYMMAIRHHSYPIDNNQQQQPILRDIRPPVQQIESARSVSSARNLHNHLMTLPKSNFNHSESFSYLPVSCPTTRKASTVVAPNVTTAFIIAGAQKSGTTALFTLLQQLHPQWNASTAAVTTVAASTAENAPLLWPTRRVETHFFDQTASLRQELRVLDESLICRLRQHYLREFDWKQALLPETMSISSPQQSQSLQSSQLPSLPTIVTLEKCPIYMCKPRIPHHVAQILPHSKILLVLRNPIERAYSHWHMMHGHKKQKRPSRNGKWDESSFEGTLQRELTMMRFLGVTRAPMLDDFLQNYANQSVQLSHFDIPETQTLERRSGIVDIGPDHRNYHSRQRNHASCGYLSRGLYSNQVYNWMRASFRLGASLLVIRYEDFVQDKSSVLRQISMFAGLDDPDMASNEAILHNDYSPRQAKRLQEDNKATERRQHMDPRVREYLVHYYKPYNDELADLLGEEWRNVWN
jgi:Sulfotransferase domain